MVPSYASYTGFKLDLDTQVLDDRLHTLRYRVMQVTQVPSKIQVLQVIDDMLQKLPCYHVTWFFFFEVDPLTLKKITEKNHCLQILTIWVYPALLHVYPLLIHSCTRFNYFWRHDVFLKQVKN